MADATEYNVRWPLYDPPSSPPPLCSNGGKKVYYYDRVRASVVDVVATRQRRRFATHLAVGRLPRPCRSFVEWREGAREGGRVSWTSDKGGHQC